MQQVAKLVLDPTEGAPTLQEFAKRCQKIADIAEALERVGWDIEADLSYEALVIASPPHEVECEEELLSLVEALGIDIKGVGYPEMDDDEDLEEAFDDDFFDMDIDDEDDDDDEDDGPLLDQEQAQNLIGKRISDVDNSFDTMTLKFDDGSKLIIDGYEAILEE